MIGLFFVGMGVILIGALIIWYVINNYVLKDESIPGNGTFIYNDKLVLQPTHILKLKEPGTQAFDYVISYIDQDWS